MKFRDLLNVCAVNELLVVTINDGIDWYTRHTVDTYLNKKEASYLLEMRVKYLYQENNEINVILEGNF